MATRKTKKKAAKKAKKKSAARRAKPQPFELSAEPGIRDVAELYQALAKRIEEAEPVVIDASGVTRIDTAVMQTLVAFVRAREAAERTVEWKAPSETFLQVAEQLDLTRHLACESGTGG
ncbi:MAG: STAS domain-containing protein [Xanthomonadales bacterium]|nr:STAS domain-containing protein [Xanthomonadales bacterium]